MSLLHTLEVQGIRSIGIGSHNAAVIEILSPLTIICGPNGTGKTTIIEALKYATTGEVPPGKMQSFIHDLRLANKNRVDASVKLKFIDCNGRKCVVTRRMCARSEGTKGKVTTKSEECTIAIESSSGEWKSLSSKVVDSKKEILNLIGVPTAILDYIIFCHQEESTWPLDEPKKLKERFDEIFQVKGYVKAVESLKKAVKENVIQLQISQARLPLLMKQKQDKYQLQTEYLRLKEMVEKKEKEIEINNSEGGNLKIELDKVVKDLIETEKAEREYDITERELRLLVEQFESSKVSDYNGSITELKSEIETLEKSNDYIDMEQNYMMLRKRQDELKMQEKRMTKERSDTNCVLNDLRATAMMVKKLVDEQGEYRQKIRNEYSINENDEMKALNSVLSNYQTDLDSLKKKADDFISNQEQTIDSIRTKIAEVKSELIMKRNECNKLKANIEFVEKELLQGAKRENEIADLEQNIETLERELKALELQKIDRKDLESLKIRRDETGYKIDYFQKKIRARERFEEHERKIQDKMADLTKLENNLKEFNQKHQDSLIEVFDGEKVEYPIHDQLSVFMRRISKKISLAIDDYQECEKNLNVIKQRIFHIKKEIDEIDNTISDYIKKISKFATNEESLETLLNTTNQLLKKSRRSLSLFDAYSSIYEEWKDEINKHHSCPLCERSYDQPNDVNKLLEKIDVKICGLPKEMSKIEDEMKENENLQAELISLSPFVQFLKEIQSKKADRKADLFNCEQKLKKVEHNTEKARLEMDAVQSKFEFLKPLQNDAALIDNIWQTKHGLEKEIRLLNAQMEQEDSEKHSVQDLRHLLAEHENEFKNILSSIDLMQEKASEMNNLMNKINTFRERRVNLVEKSAQSDSLKKSLEQDKINCKKYLEEVRALETQLPSLQNQQKAHVAEKQSSVQKYKCLNEVLLENISKAENMRSHLNLINKRIIELSDNAWKLETYEKQLDSLNMEWDRLTGELRAIDAELNNFSSKQERKNKLEEQLRRIHLRQRIAAAEECLTNLRVKSESCKRLRTENDVIKERFNLIMFEVERKKGEVLQQKERLMEVKQRLETKEMIQVDEDLKKELINKCIAELVGKDLSTYVRVLDESIVKYHTKKMEEVNEVLTDLWERVYKGNDIKKIQIKSESVDDNEKRKSYNYRVVMCMDDMELDMPGRCSAGQKMLASLLIRIALSDVFCDKCCVIALDEPTTNLDVLKVENLGDMLAAILEARCNFSAKKFQLIIITHDDRFVEHLRQLCHPEWVYALSKDSEGLSRVKRHVESLDSCLHY